MDAGHRGLSESNLGRYEADLMVADDDFASVLTYLGRTGNTAISTT